MYFHQIFEESVSIKILCCTVLYQWQKKSCTMEEWEDMAVPPNTCLLYVDTAQQYRCTVEEKSVAFNL